MSNANTPQTNGFQLKCANDSTSSSTSTFAQRSQNIFAEIDVLEKHNSGSTLELTKSTSNSANSASSAEGREQTEVFRNRESIFKLSEREESGWPPSSRSKPYAGKWERGRDQDSDFRPKSSNPTFKRPNQRKNTPDHVKNPKKYTKYSLADAPGVTDRSNTAAAFDFLREQEKQKTCKINLQQEDSTEVQDKVVFRKPKTKNESGAKNESSELATKCMSSKRILPEAVVGRSSSFRTLQSSTNMTEAEGADIDQKSGKSTQTKVKKNKNKQSMLAHLMYDEDDS